MFWRLWRKFLINEVVDMVLLFNMIMSLVGYYFDPTTRDEDLQYCRHVLLYRPGRSPLPDWIRSPIESRTTADGKAAEGRDPC